MGEEGMLFLIQSQFRRREMNSDLRGEGNKNREENLLRLQRRFPEAHKEILIQRDLTSATWWKHKEVLVGFFSTHFLW